LPTTLLVLGLLIGSFLNMAVYRFPIIMERQLWIDIKALLEEESGYRTRALESLGLDRADQKLKQQLDTYEEAFEAAGKNKFNFWTPNSRCPHCDAAILPWQNIPVVSYLLLGGKCGNCSQPISLRYPVLELSTGLMTMALAWFFPPDISLFGALLFTWSIIALSVIDADTRYLPDQITVPLFGLGLLFNINSTYTTLADATLGALFGYLFFWSVYWIFKLVRNKEGLGYGDFKLLAAFGAWMGLDALLPIVLLSSLVGASGSLILMALRNRDINYQFPYGPYLAIAGWLTFIWPEWMGTLLGIDVHWPFFEALRNNAP